MATLIKKYSTIDYAVLKELDISPNELAYLDMVYYLSRAGSEWCYKSLQNIADDLNLGKSTIKSMRDRLLQKELIVRNKEGFTKTTEPVHNSYGVRYSHENPNSRAKNAPYRAKSEQNRAISAPKIYSRVTKNIESEPALEKPLASDKSFRTEWGRRKKLGPPPSH